MEVKDFLKTIGESKDTEKMEALGNFLEKVMDCLEDLHPDIYKKYLLKLYEIAYGKKLNEELALNWILSMKPYGLKWDKEQTSNVLKEKNINNINEIDFWAMMNAMYNDYYNTVKEDVEEYYNLAKDFINDEDGSKEKVYMYWKYCTNNII